jgi:hypothetical protein
MSEKNQNEFLNDIQYNPTKEINKMLDTIKSKKSECWDKDEQNNIHLIIGENIGFDRIDSLIFQQLREWVIKTTKLKYENESENENKLKLMHCLASLHYIQGKIQISEDLFKDCFDKRKNDLGEDHKDTLVTMQSVKFYFINYIIYILIYNNLFIACKLLFMSR